MGRVLAGKHGALPTLAHSLLDRTVITLQVLISQEIRVSYSSQKIQERNARFIRTGVSLEAGSLRGVRYYTAWGETGPKRIIMREGIQTIQRARCCKHSISRAWGT